LGKTDAANYSVPLTSVPINVLKATPIVAVYGGGIFLYDGAAHVVTGAVAGINATSLGAATIS
jgi:hypothetical protein